MKSSSCNPREDSPTYRFLSARKYFQGKSLYTKWTPASCIIRYIWPEICAHSLCFSVFQSLTATTKTCKDLEELPAVVLRETWAFYSVILKWLGKIGQCCQVHVLWSDVLSGSASCGPAVLAWVVPELQAPLQTGFMQTGSSRGSWD